MTSRPHISPSLHDPGSPGNALMTQFDEHSPSVSPSGILQYGVPASQSALVKHGVPCPSTGETKSSVMVDTAKRNAARLAPLLCSERISPLLCRCSSRLFLGRSGRRLLGCTLCDGVQVLLRGPPRTCTWFSFTCARFSRAASIVFSVIRCHHPPSHITPRWFRGGRCGRGGHFAFISFHF